MSWTTVNGSTLATNSNFSFTIAANATLNIIVSSTSYAGSYSSAHYLNLRKLTLTWTCTATISKDVYTRKSLPRELKNIGKNITSTLYGYHLDKETWYTGD